MLPKRVEPSQTLKHKGLHGRSSCIYLCTCIYVYKYVHLHIQFVKSAAICYSTSRCVIQHEQHNFLVVLNIKTVVTFNKSNNHNDDTYYDCYL